MNNRAQNLIDKLPAGFEAALVQTPVNRRYFLDLNTHDAGTLLILPGKMVFIIDSRYIEVAKEKVQDAEILLESSSYNALGQVADILREHGVKKLYTENQISIALFEQVKKKLEGIEVDASPTLSNAILALRQIKDEEELGRMRQAQKITDDCFTHICGFIKAGMREIDIALEMEHYMRTHGAEGLAFETICVAGSKTSLPHGSPGENTVREGDFLTLDFGANYEGYCADMTRTVAVGEPGEEKRKIYDLVLKAHLAGIEAAAAGKVGSEVDKVARDIITEGGYGENFGHGLGHALGLEVHEEPRFSPKSTEAVQAGMVMSVEPGIYLPGQFGCRIEDAVVIREGGCEPLPKSPKELLVL